MSEFQYYEFQAIDRPLTPEEQQAVARLSSRVDPHPRRAVFTYSWSDFPARSEEVLTRYYDAMLYMANWGRTQLMFRFPQALVDLGQMEQYNVQTHDYPSDVLTVSSVGEYVILSIRADAEAGDGWIESEGCLDGLIGLREAILHGDYRLLYLAWLMGLALEYDVDEGALEPPVPPGLNRLTPSLQNFVELFGVDEDLIEVAAEGSGEAAVVSEDELRRAIAALPSEEKDAFLLRLAQGEPLLSLAFKRRLDVWHDASQGDRARRTVGQLLAAAEALVERERQGQAAKAEARRIAEMEALAQREAQTWEEIEALIQRSQAKPYDQATRLLVQLKELAAYQGREADFEARLGEVVARYQRRRALLERFRRAGLI